MDTPCIITQVSRDEEPINNSSQPSENSHGRNGAVNGNKKERCHNRNNGGFFKRLFSCCWRSPPSTCTENDECPGYSSQVASSAASTTNGSVIGDEMQNNYPNSMHLLPPIQERDTHKKCMVIDLDETLVHSSFKPISNADFVVPVEIDGTVHQVYVLKRPRVDDFLQKVGELYECILFTASLAKYADPVADLLDKWGVFRGRLFRESCVFHRGNYVKDLSRLGRDLHKVVIMDNSPASYIFHPDNAVPVSSWFDDMTDTELVDLLPFLETLSHVDSVYSVLRGASPHPIQNNNDQMPPPSTSPITQILPPSISTDPPVS